MPRLHNALELAREGIITGASGRNWSGYGARVKLGAGLGEAEKSLLTDPQTSGGLLVACSPDTTKEVLEVFRAEGFDRAAVIGEITAGEPEVIVA